MAMHPDSATVEEVAHAPPKRVYQLLDAFERVARQIDDRIPVKFSDSVAEIATGLFLRTVESDTSDLAPRFVRMIRLSGST